MVERICESRTAHPYITGQALMYSNNVADVLVRHDPRRAATATTACAASCRWCSTILFSYSVFPLRAAAAAGFVVASAASCSAPSTSSGLFVETPVPGWTTIAVLLAVLNGVVIMLLSMLGEYVVRTLNAVSARDHLPRDRTGLLVTRHLLLIGAQRCGTTYLGAVLDAHPEITMARPARPEPKVFCDEARPRGATGTATTYFAHAGDERLLGDKSTSYLEDPEAPARAPEVLGRGPRPRGAARSGAARGVELAVQHRATGWRPHAWRRRCARTWPARERGTRAAPRSRRSPTSSAVDTSTTSVRGCGPSPTPRTCCSSRSCSPTGHLPDDLWPPSAWHRPRSRAHDDAVNQSPGEPPVLSAEIAGHTGGVLRVEQPSPGRSSRTGAAVVSDAKEEPDVTDVNEVADLSRAELPDIPFNLAVAGGPRARVHPGVRPRRPPRLRRGVHPTYGGPARRETGAHEVLMTTSCTAALELSAMLLDLKPGDTVIVPSFTFTTTALAYARQGAGLVFCDIEPRTLGLDPEHLASLLDEHVRAVVVVHYAGVACDIDGIRAVLADWPDVDLIEDNAHGLFGSWHDQPLGSFGRFAALSFHETKNFVCGEGGALLLNDPRDVDRARVLYDKGTNRRAFMLGQVDKYTWKDTGSSFGLADVLAAYLLAQLEQREVIQAKRRAVHEHYAPALAPQADELGFELMEVPPGSDSAYHMFYVLLPRPRPPRRRTGVDAQAGSARDLPLHAAAQLGRRPGLRGAADRLPGLRRHQRAAAAPAVLQQPGRDDLDRVVETFRSSAERPGGSRGLRCHPPSRGPRR